METEAMTRPLNDLKIAEFYHAQADNPDNSPSDRALWRQLADELDQRFGDGSPVIPADDPLF